MLRWVALILLLILVGLQLKLWSGAGSMRDVDSLRIAVKKLRYTAEFFASLYPRKKVKRYIKKVRRLQEYLGEINDIAHVRTTLSVLLQDKPKPNDGDLRFAAGMVSGWYRARRPRLAKKALKRWDKFRGLKPFWT